VGFTAQVSHHPSNGITFVSGGKWTTWREMAEDGVEQVIQRHPELKKKAQLSKTWAFDTIWLL
jgi:glycerol-3-phosphate dehydrogenase